MRLVLLGKEERSKMRQKCVKIASKMRGTPLGENTFWTIPIKSLLSHLEFFGVSGFVGALLGHNATRNGRGPLMSCCSWRRRMTMTKIASRRISLLTTIASYPFPNDPISELLKIIARNCKFGHCHHNRKWIAIAKETSQPNNLQEQIAAFSLHTLSLRKRIANTNRKSLPGHIALRPMKPHSTRTRPDST